MAEYRASLFGKCLNKSTSETPAASASARVVVFSNPLSTKTPPGRADDSRATVRAGILEDVFMESSFPGLW